MAYFHTSGNWPDSNDKFIKDVITGTKIAHIAALER